MKLVLGSDDDEAILQCLRFAGQYSLRYAHDGIVIDLYTLMTLYHSMADALIREMVE